MLENREGQIFPFWTFRTRHNRQWVDLTADRIFEGKTVIVFVLPGAFGASHVSTRIRSNNQLSPSFRRYRMGRYRVDEVVCISASDAFVMSEPCKVREAFKMSRPLDGKIEFSGNMGVLVAANDLGFGDLSRRYSVLVENGVIEKMFEAPGAPGDPFEVLDADPILGHLAPIVVKQRNVATLSRDQHASSANARTVLRDTSVRFQKRAF